MILGRLSVASGWSREPSHRLIAIEREHLGTHVHQRKRILDDALGALKGKACDKVEIDEHAARLRCTDDGFDTLLGVVCSADGVQHCRVERLKTHREASGSASRENRELLFIQRCRMTFPGHVMRDRERATKRIHKALQLRVRKECRRASTKRRIARALSPQDASIAIQRGDQIGHMIVEPRVVLVQCMPALTERAMHRAVREVHVDLQRLRRPRRTPSVEGSAPSPCDFFKCEGLGCA